MKTIKIKSIFIVSIFWLTTGLVNLASAVTCQTTFDCANPSQNYCKKDSGTCPGLGTCEPRPTACASFYAPVCSCDGLDYPNECKAAQSGKTANYEGTCVTCPDFDNDGACDGADNCEGNYNPDQADLDGDGIGDVCDPCPNDYLNDIDNDTLCGDVDTCPNDQTNTCTVYEDGEDALTTGWSVHDGFPVASTIANVNDPVRGSRVIELSGGGVSNAYALKGNGGAPWSNSGQKILNFSVEFSEYFAVLVHLNTSNGPRILTYVPINNSPMGSKVYVTYGLGSTSMNGQWHDFSRDLQADLNAAQPGNTILSVEGMIIRGSGRLDDISLQ